MWILNDLQYTEYKPWLWYYQDAIARNRVVIMTKIEAKVVAAWQEAATELGFQFISPFTATAHTGKKFEALALVSQYGGRIGTLISVGGEPSADAMYPMGEGYSESCLGRTGYLKYNRAEWIEMLCDWGFWGDPTSAPSWYAPGPHCHLKSQTPIKPPIISSE